MITDDLHHCPAPQRYYRTVAVLFITYAAACRGVDPKDYIECFNRGLFNMSGKELVPDEALRMIEGKDTASEAAFEFARIYGEAGLNKLWEIASYEEKIFGDAPGP